MCHFLRNPHDNHVPFPLAELRLTAEDTISSANGNAKRVFGFGMRQMLGCTL